MPELVAIAEQLLAPVPGGTGRYTRELLRALAASAPEGWSVRSVVSRSGDPTAAQVPGVEGPQVLPLPRRALIAAWERGLPPRLGGAAVHAMTPLAPPARRGRSLVVTVHDAVPWTHPETLTARGAAWHRRAIARAAREADALVVPTRAVAAELAEHLGTRPRVEVVGEGVAADLLGEPRDPGLPDGPYVAAVGTVEPRKGFADLVRAMGEPEAPDVPLVIVGRPGWGDVDLPRVAERTGTRLRVLAGLTDQQLAAVLRRASALAVPSLSEGFGLPLLEAMTLGVPVVHSDAPALVEVAGGAGLQVRRADPPALAAALRTAVHDQSRRAAMIAAGRRRAREFSWESTARRVWAVHLERTAQIG
ncbi:glycosyltransferase family 4 protein [Saccharopolyspora griseoalba]|uniref:Glycosyltransferase family 4 protein n=1 Tax=Saccharopolyspora griseoalba TaxID=1431848 RepID=A0ABW2LIL6_9PSEU